MFVGFLRLRLGPHDVITCHIFFLLYLFNLRAWLFSQDGKRLNIHLKVMNKRVFIINNLLKFFFGFFVVTHCGSFVTCCGSFVICCGSSAILLSAYKFFHIVNHLST